MRKLILLLASALILSIPLHAQTQEPPGQVRSAEDLGLKQPIEKELASIVLDTVGDKAKLGTNSSADFAAFIRHAVKEVEKKGGATPI